MKKEKEAQFSPIEYFFLIISSKYNAYNASIPALQRFKSSINRAKGRGTALDISGKTPFSPCDYPSFPEMTFYHALPASNIIDFKFGTRAVVSK